VTYATDRLFEEIAYVAYHLHWSFEEILDLEHPVRQRVVEEIAGINRRLAEEQGLSLRSAALVAGIREVGAALTSRGIYP